ncbi:MAG: plasmid recombination protein [Flavobacteriaceae bacterium]|nr:plasmid recombination protein [Flavobacteriaceae bacterium]MCY4268445.1 plasmid recombination protein [Flavobacteriaceae bacterium]MCY4299933.1 plasmid recombination protein [Flavobacteriaceae bacterium]
MATQYAVYRMASGKSLGVGLGHHIDRVQGKEWSFRHADPQRVHLNWNKKIPEYSALPMHQAIKKRIQMGHTISRKIRSNQVLFHEHILTGSSKRMHEIFADKKLREQWISSNWNFMCHEFGKENIVRFVLHRDEKTPHLHVVTVPIIDGALNASHYFSSRFALKRLQTEYANSVSMFGLSRGIEDTGARNVPLKVYYKKMAHLGVLLDRLSQRANDMEKKLIHQMKKEIQEIHYQMKNH